MKQATKRTVKMSEDASVLKYKSKLNYLLIDYIAVIIVWLWLAYFRTDVLNGRGNFLIYVQHVKALQVVTIFIAIPFFWILLFAVSGSYRESVYEKSRFNELVKTLFQSLIGCLLIFFFYFLKQKEDPADYFEIFIAYCFLQFLVVYSLRLVQLTVAKANMRAERFYFRTVFIGSNGKALESFDNLKDYYRDLGYKISGYISDGNSVSSRLFNKMNCIGTIENVGQIINAEVEQVIIALEENKMYMLSSLINELSEKDVLIKIVPDNLDIIKGSVRTGNVLNAPFISINTEVMTNWEYNVKQAFDKIMAVVLILIVSPLILFVAIRTWFSTKGRIIYKQRRVGLKGRPFTMYKFQSMYNDAEASGPQLSCENDKRITKWGKIMRRWRLDELPQFWNILKGDMSFVGPRPERRYFIDKISEQTPYYKYLLKVKPGLTSWGMVRFGYASNIEEMQERMRYDLMYIENA
ncbi:MAG TPA: sugar transferase, partial [Arachidicoccus sp.]